MHRHWMGRVLIAACAVGPTAAHAKSFDIPAWGEEDIAAQLNTTLTVGAAMRMENRADDLVGKGNLNPQVCGRENGRLRWQSCQGLFRTQIFPAQHLVDAPGAFTSNADDGNLNYDRHDLTQAPAKVVMDLKLSRGEWGLFVKGLYHYDFVNNDFTEHHPNRVTRGNLDQVGNVSMPGDELLPAPAPVPLPVLGVRSDSRPCPASRNPTGLPCGLVYGAGGVVDEKRRDGETLRQVGTGFQLLDALIYGALPLPFDRKLTVKIGRQSVNWGESTLMFFDSINQANPVNANNLFRVGFQVDELATPVAMAFLATDLFEGASIEGFYQLEWQPTVVPPPGSFYSPIDIGSDNAIGFLTLGFGQSAEDPDHVARLLDNSLSGLTNTTASIERLPDRTPGWAGQFGVSFKYYADWLNNGTEIDLYYMNYHSRLPYLSLYSVPDGCARYTTNLTEFSVACNDTPLMHSLTDPNHPEAATSDAVHFDYIKFFLEYPRNVHLYGLSFNTAIGDISLQGEIGYRPDAPLQVDAEDLAFAAYGPAATLCHLPETGCSGSGRGNVAGLLPPELGLPLDALGIPLSGVGLLPDGSLGTYPNSDYVTDAQGTPGAFHDTYDLVIGHMMGSGRAFPAFITPYRGTTIGTNPQNSYIRGWEYFDTWQFNLGATYLMGSTQLPSRLIFADQIILLAEVGATWVPDLPPLDELQLEAPGTFLHASAGADGSGSDRSRQACSTNPACSYGPDGVRFNPHQEDLDLYPDRVSWGYDIVGVILYESVLPGISLRPYLIWKHDVQGTAPGLAANFINDRMLFDGLLEIRYKDRLSLNIGYNLWAGGGKANLLRDRDTLRAFVKYQF